MQISEITAPAPEATRAEHLAYARTVFASPGQYEDDEMLTACAAFLVFGDAEEKARATDMMVLVKGECDTALDVTIFKDVLRPLSASQGDTPAGPTPPKDGGLG